MPRRLGLSNGPATLASCDLVCQEWHDWTWSIAKKRSQQQSVRQQYRLKRLAFHKKEALNPRNKSFIEILSSRAWSFMSLSNGNRSQGKHPRLVGWSLLIAMDFVPWQGGEASCLWHALWLLGRSLSFLLPTGDEVRCSFSGPSDGFPFRTQHTNQTPKSSMVTALLEADVGKHLFVVSPTNWSEWPVQCSEEEADLVGCFQVLAALPKHPLSLLGGGQKGSSWLEVPVKWSGYWQCGSPGQHWREAKRAFMQLISSSPLLFPDF